METFPNKTFKDKVNSLEKKRRNILVDKDFTWRLKRRDLWPPNNDEKSKYFFQCKIHRKNMITILKILRNNG